MEPSRYDPPRRGLALLGYAALILALPLALFGLTPANEYESWGGAGVDCDGPGTVLFFAPLGLLIYGAGALLNGRHYRQPFKLVVAMICLGICLTLSANIYSAIREQRINEQHRETCG